MPVQCINGRCFNIHLQQCSLDAGENEADLCHDVFYEDGYLCEVHL